MTPTQLLDETIEYYRTNPRGVNPHDRGGCVYRTSDEPGAAMCAVGRCMDWAKMTPEEADVIGDSSSMAYAFLRSRIGNGPTFSDYMQEQYRDLPDSVFADLQSLHDASSYWRANGEGGQSLTERGQQVAEETRRHFDTLS